MYESLIEHGNYQPSEIWNTDATSWDPEKAKKGKKVCLGGGVIALC
jgi:hypothetical protein